MRLVLPDFLFITTLIHLILSSLKIVHISTFAFGGAGIAAYRIHEALLDNGVSSDFLCLEAGNFDTSKHCHQVEKPYFNILQRAFKKLIRITNKYYIFGKISPRTYYTKNLERIRPELKCEGASLPYSNYMLHKHPIVKEADIIHLHWVAGFLDYPSFFKYNTKPVVWTFHDMNPATGLFHYVEDAIRNASIAGKLSKAITAVKRKVIKSRRFKMEVVCPSQWLLQEVLASPVFESIRTCRIFYPLNTIAFSPQSTDRLRQELGIPLNKTILLFVSQSVEYYRKGFDLLSTAISNIKAADISVLVIGYSTKSTVVENNFTYLGSISDIDILTKYYSLADAFVIPSREDNLPNVMLESMSCGTPVISFEVGGMSEVIKNNFNGLKASTLNVESLQQTIERFVENRHQYERSEIRKFALNNFSNNTIADQYLEVYGRLLSN